MAQSEALNGARGHIAWIVALALSTTAIIYLENLDIGQPKRSHAVLAELAESATQALVVAEQRHLSTPADPDAAIGLILALSVAVQAGVLDPAEGRSRVASLRRAIPDVQVLEAVDVLVDLTFTQ